MVPTFTAQLNISDVAEVVLLGMITYFVKVPISCGNVANRFEYKYNSVNEDATSLTDDGSVFMLDFDRSSLVRPSSLHLLNSRGRS
jgi:hypothetical protein